MLISTVNSLFLAKKQSPVNQFTYSGGKNSWEKASVFVLELETMDIKIIINVYINSPLNTDMALIYFLF